MQTKSRDGKLIISAPDTAKTGCSLSVCGEDESKKFDEEIDVVLRAVEGKKVDLYDVARCIAYDCFDSDSVGLHLLARKLNCKLIIGNNQYKFSATEHFELESYLIEIVHQIEL